jgi:hypothetical protein
MAVMAHVLLLYWWAKLGAGLVTGLVTGSTLPVTMLNRKINATRCR